MNHYFQIAKLVRCCERIEGRAKLQKIVHILQDLGHPFREEFGYLHHGPYSSDLKSEIDQLLKWNLLDEAEAHSAGQHARFDYTGASLTPSDALTEVLGPDALEDESNPPSDDPAWTESARELNQKSAQELEGISTILFLRRRGFEDDRLKARFDELKPHLREMFDRCFEETERFRSAGTASSAAAAAQ